MAARSGWVRRLGHAGVTNVKSVGWALMLVACGGGGEAGVTAGMPALSAEPGADVSEGGVVGAAGMPALSAEPGADVSEGGVVGAAGIVAAGALPAAQCEAPFRACGGTLAGSWQLEGSCELPRPEQVVREPWFRELFELEPSTCAGAVQRWTSSWSGRVLFEGGDLMDERSRFDAVELSLAGECLEAAVGPELSGADMGAACSALSREGVSCSPAASECHCSVAREVEVNDSGPYGVLGTQVAVLPAAGPVRVDYCVQGERLFWQESGTRQRLQFGRAL